MKDYSQKPKNTSRTLVEREPQSSKQAPISEILQAYKTGNWFRQPIQQKTEEEELTSDQPSGYAAMLKIMERNDRILQQYAPEKKEEPLQEKAEPIQRQEKPNNTGLPDKLKTGIETLSGYSMDDVQVHYNSNKPAQLNALAYAQGTDIHIGPGQEKHLPHEVWHVVQQKQGRVQPTTQLQGVNVNDNEGLEKEADIMGLKAIKAKGLNNAKSNSLISNITVQLEGGEDDTITLTEGESQIVVSGKTIKYSPLSAGCMAVTVYFQGGGGAGIHLFMFGDSNQWINFYESISDHNITNVFVDCDVLGGPQDWRVNLGENSLKSPVALYFDFSTQIAAIQTDLSEVEKAR